MIKTVDASDRKLLEGLRQAEPGQVKLFYDAYLPGIVAYVRRHGGNEADGKDVFQDAAFVLYRKVRTGDFELTTSLRTYLLAVCRNIWRTKVRDQRDQRLSPEAEERQPDLDEDTLQQITRLSRERLYRDHMNRLGDQCRQILQLFFEKASMQEIADRLGLSPGYVKKKKFLCKEKLVEAIRQDPRYQELKF